MSIEDAYVRVLLTIMREQGVHTLAVKGLEKNFYFLAKSNNFQLYTNKIHDLYTKVLENDLIDIEEIGNLVRLILRDNLWCKLEYNNKLCIHFGHDYYMYVGY